MATVTAYYKNDYIGGASNALDSEDGAKLNQNDFAFIMKNDVISFHILNATSGAAEDPPNVVEPDANAGDKRWILQGVLNALSK